MLSYLFEAGICWVAFYLLYIAFLQKETFFHLNRTYLLGTLVLGLLIPSFSFSLLPIAQEETPVMAYFLQPITVTVQNLEYSMEAIVINSEETATFNWQGLLLLIYVLGVLVSLFKMLFGLYQIAQLYRKSEIVDRKAYRLVKTEGTHSPFSFFNLLFWSKNRRLEEEEERHILQHELAHMQQGHSMDVILLEILGILFWCLPPVHFYKKALRTVHEYLADAAVYNKTPKKQYGQLLLKQAQSGPALALGHSFFHSQLKQRIIMMTKNKSSRKSLVKYFGLLPIAAVLLLTLSSQNTKEIAKEGLDPISIFSNSSFLSQADPFDREKVIEKLGAIVDDLLKAEGCDSRGEFCTTFEMEYVRLLSAYPEKKEDIIELAQEVVNQKDAPIAFIDEEGTPMPRFMESKDGRGFAVVEEMPRFAGCEDLEGEERKKCAVKNMLMHTYKSIKYPAEARENNIQGTVVARFLIDEEGKIIDPKIVRSIGGGCDEEVLRVIGTMPDFIPGRHKGKAVKVVFNLPVKFKLEGKAKEKETIVDESDSKPRFPGCEKETTEEAKNQCATNNLINFLVSHIKYPQDAREKGIEGVVALQFVVGKNGVLKKPELLKSVGYGCDEEVLRVFNIMRTEIDPWEPGQMENGDKVAVKYTLPVAFRLQAKEKEKIAHPSLGLSLNNFKAYPNPVEDQLTVQFDAKALPTNITLMDVDGKVISEIQLQDFNGHYEGQLEVNKTTSGTLLLNIRQGEQVFVQKILVQR